MRYAGQRTCWPFALSGQYRMLAIFCLTSAIFLVLQQTLHHLHRPTVIKTDTIPKKVWQSWKVDVLHFEERDLDRARTWVAKNPNYRYELLTDNNAIPYVEQAFGPKALNRPDIIATYKALNQNLKIIQADLLRYIIMYVDGGIWADIDVEDVQPVRTWVPRAYDPMEIDMVIGIETDEPGLLKHPILGSKAQSFCQWTFMCKPGLPVMLRLIENIMKWLHKLAEEQGKSVSELHLNFDEVLSGTGPSAFTNAILAEMSISVGDQVVWDDFHDLVDSQLIGGVLVLPSEAFAAGTGHSRSGNHGGSRALVKHHFHASSWTSKHQRKKHPVYDEVEKCNWDVECVQLWDTNVAFYNSLPEDEQLKMIELKRIDEAKAAKAEKAAKDAAARAAAAAEQQQQPIVQDPKDEDDEKESTSEGNTPPAVDGTPKEDAKVAPHPLLGVSNGDKGPPTKAGPDAKVAAGEPPPAKPVDLAGIAILKEAEEESKAKAEAKEKAG